MKIETLYYNGVIHTMDNQNKICDSIGVKEGKIVFVGNYDKIKDHEIKEKINLEKKLVLPGFVDTHLHILEYAEQKQMVNLIGLTKVDEIIEKCKNHYKENGLSNGWLIGNGWNQNGFTDGNDFIYREDLDKISTQYPIILIRACLHVAVGNSKAMELFKKDEKIKEYLDFIDFEKGILREKAVTCYKKITKKLEIEDIKKLILSSHEDLLKAGITQVHTADFFSVVAEEDWERVIRAYKELEKENKLKVKTYEQCMFFIYENYEKFLKSGYRTGMGTDKFRIGPLKLITDGSLGARTAYLLAPYSDDKNTRGILNLSKEELERFIISAKENSMQLAIHTIGDGAAMMTVDLLNKYNAKDLKNPKRDGLVHAQILNDEILNKMVKGNITTYIQPVFIDEDMKITRERLGKTRESHSYIWKTMLDKGLLLSGGSDSPVVSFNILENIYFAVARKDMLGNPKNSWYPKEKLSVDEAIKLFTKNASYHSFEENKKGSLELGKVADMVVLNEDIYKIDEDEIKNVLVDMTIIDGQIIYRR